MNKEIFLHELADVMQFCEDNNTDTCEIELEYGDKVLVINFAFEIKEKEKNDV